MLILLAIAKIKSVKRNIVFVKEKISYVNLNVNVINVQIKILIKNRINLTNFK